MNLTDKSRKQQVVASSPNAAEEADEKKRLTVEQVPGEEHDLTLTRARMHPVLHAAATMLSFDKPLNDHKLMSIATELGQHEKDVKAGSMGRAESILINQANTLDVIFNTLAQRAGAQVGKSADLADKYLRMALKAQSQCRTTLEALAEIKTPKSVSFIKQTNVAGQQQVNNGNVTNGRAAASHEKKLTPTNELITEAPHATLDTGYACKAGGADPQMAALGEVDRPANRGGKGAQ